MEHRKYMHGGSSFNTMADVEYCVEDKVQLLLTLYGKHFLVDPKEIRLYGASEVLARWLQF